MGLPRLHNEACAHIMPVVLQAGGLDGLRKDPAKLKAAVEFATACGAFVTTKPGAIDAQPSQQEAEHLLKTARHA